jgi:hypothetical protein
MQDLTDMLGGAIDEIGLVNSRDLPPPGIAEPPKDMDHHLILKNPPPRHSSMANAMMMDSPTTISPTATHTFAHHQRAPCSQGSIGLGLGAVGGGAVTMGSVGGVAQSGRGNVSRHVRKASSILSLRTNNFNNSPTVTVFAAGAAALPPAVLFGNIKALKTPGERARAYEKSSSDLFSADSGLRDIYMTLRECK